MAVKKTKIEYQLSLDSDGFSKKLSVAGKKISYTAKQINRDFAPVTGVFKKLATNITYAGTAAGVAATVGGFYALQTVLRSSVTDALALDRAMYNMGASLDAANRQFDVGSVSSWETTLKSLRTELKIFSETDLRNASARTIDMTKRLGLSEEQMRKVMVTAADLGAGKFALVDSVERITAALRGEAEASEALGLTLNEDYVKGWYKANDATGKAWKSLTDVEKAQVRFNILLEQAGPSAGRAAGSYDTMSGVISAVKASYNELYTSLGGIITKNAFFVESVKVVNELLQEWKGNIDENRNDWMEWSKQSALSVMEFTADFADGMDTVYRALHKVSGILSLSWGGTVKLGQGFQYLFEQSNRFFGDDEKAEYWAQAQKESAAIVENAMESAAAAFDKSDTGLEAAKKAAERIRQLKDELEKLDAKPLDEVATAAKKTATEMKEVDGVWKETYTKIAKAGNATTTDQVEDLDKFKDENGKTWRQIEEDAGKSIQEIYNELQKLTEKKWVADVNITSSGGGGGDGYAVGGRVTGPGGIDKVSAWLTKDEVVIKEPSVRAAGLRAALAFNSGNWGVVIEELQKRFSNRFQHGGVVGLPSMPNFNLGGVVSAGAGGGSVTMHIYDHAEEEQFTLTAPTKNDYDAFERMQRRKKRLSST